MDIRTELAMEVWKDNLEKDECPEMADYSRCVECVHFLEVLDSETDEESSLCSIYKEYVDEDDAYESRYGDNACSEFE